MEELKEMTIGEALAEYSTFRVSAQLAVACDVFNDKEEKIFEAEILSEDYSCVGLTVEHFKEWRKSLGGCWGDDVECVVDTRYKRIVMADSDIREEPYCEITEDEYYYRAKFWQGVTDSTFRNVDV